MKNRKRQVIDSAFELFTTKGFQATSIQDILEHSGISKGTFYNYFSSKQEVLISAVIEMQRELVKRREDYILPEQMNQKEPFIQQVIMTIDYFNNTQTSLLFHELLSSGQYSLKKDMHKIFFQHIYWMIKRLQDLFGPDIYPHAVDLSIMFTEVLSGFFRYNRLHLQKRLTNEEIVRFTFQQLEILANHALSSKEVLLSAPTFEQYHFPSEQQKTFPALLAETVQEMKSIVQSTLTEQEKIDEQIHLLDFLLEELLQTKEPREAVIGSTLYYLKHTSQPQWKQIFQQLSRLIKERQA